MLRFKYGRYCDRMLIAGLISYVMVKRQPATATYTLLSLLFICAQETSSTRTVRIVVDVFGCCS